MLSANTNPTQTILRNDTELSQEQYSQLSPASPERKDLVIPSSFNGQEIWKDFLSPVMNQGSCGSCWAFASTSTLADRFNIQSKGKMNIQLSPAKLILCNFKDDFFLNIHPDEEEEITSKANVQSLKGSACYGNTLYDAWRYLYVIGTNTEECMPYNKSVGIESDKFTELSKYQDISGVPLCNMISGKIGDMCAGVNYDDYTGEELGEAAKFFRALHFYGVNGTDKTGGSEHHIRYNIYMWGPVSTGMIVYEDFYKFNAKNSIYEWDGVSERTGGHAIEIVGWGEENNVKYWIIKNSWGKDWGRDGYFYMIRGKNSCGIEENVIACIPDFFFPKNYELMENGSKYWSENPKTHKTREEIAKHFNVFGGGIEPDTGYSRRATLTKPWLDLSRPVDLEDINFDGFIAGQINKRNKFPYLYIFIGFLLIILFFVYFRIKRNN